MSKVMVRYTVKPERAAENEVLVKRVYAELHQSKPAGFRYATFVLDDGLTFVHLASHDGEGDDNPLLKVTAFNDFRAGISDRVESAPVTSDVREIGSYGVLGD